MEMWPSKDPDFVAFVDHHIGQGDIEDPEEGSVYTEKNQRHLEHVRDAFGYWVNLPKETWW